MSNLDEDKVSIGNGVTFDEGVRFGRPMNLEFVPGTNYRRRQSYTGKIIIGDNTWVGANVCIQHGSIGTTIIGKHCWIDHLANIGHDAIIGDRTIIGVGTIILGEVEIGEDCYIAAGSVIQPRVKIGNRCMVGNNAVITKDVPDGTVVFIKGERVMRPNKWYPPNSDYDTAA